MDRPAARADAPAAPAATRPCSDTDRSPPARSPNLRRRSDRRSATWRSSEWRDRLDRLADAERARAKADHRPRGRTKTPGRCGAPTPLITPAKGTESGRCSADECARAALVAAPPRMSTVPFDCGNTPRAGAVACTTSCRRGELRDRAVGADAVDRRTVHRREPAQAAAHGASRCRCADRSRRAPRARRDQPASASNASTRSSRPRGVGRRPNGGVEIRIAGNARDAAILRYAQQQRVGAASHRRVRRCRPRRGNVGPITAGARSD